MHPARDIGGVQAKCVHFNLTSDPQNFLISGALGPSFGKEKEKGVRKEIVTAR